MFEGNERSRYLSRDPWYMKLLDNGGQNLSRLNVPAFNGHVKQRPRTNRTLHQECPAIGLKHPNGSVVTNVSKVVRSVPLVARRFVNL